MFILYAVVVGLIVGAISGGSVARLGELRIRWAALIVIGLVVQLLLFTSPLGDVLGDTAGPFVYVASNVMVLVAVARNLRIPGLILVLVGGASNLLAIVANGGFMPTTLEALEAAGRTPQDGYSNSAVLEDVVLWPLTDVFAMPAWMPAANVFSVGDVLIGIGVTVAIVAAMHGRGLASGADGGRAAPPVGAPTH